MTPAEIEQKAKDKEEAPAESNSEGNGGSASRFYQVGD